MTWVRESDHTELHDAVLYEKSFEYIQFLLQNEREFMYPEGHESMTAEEKIEVRKNCFLKLPEKNFWQRLHLQWKCLKNMQKILSR